MESQEKLEILKIEMGLIQNTLDKYDDLIFRGRNLFVTLWLSSLGLAFTIKSDFMPLLAVGVSILYWFFEGMMRHQYWFKYVDRYRFVRNSLNSPDESFTIESISVYDLTNHYHRMPVTNAQQLKVCFLKKEPTVVYALMGVGAFVVWVSLRCGWVSFPG